MKNNYIELILTIIISFIVGYAMHDNTILITVSGEELGPISEWVSAALSVISICFVYWQVNRQINKEKMLKRNCLVQYFPLMLFLDFIIILKLIFQAKLILMI